MCETEPSEIEYSEWLRPRQWLQAILDYIMKKVKLSTSTVHTHPPNGRGGANQRQKKMVIVDQPYIGMAAHGKWVDGRSKNYESIIIECQISC